MKVLPEYKSLEKLIDNVIIDLENKTFREAERLEEFLAIKWTRQALLMMKNEITAKYRDVTKNPSALNEHSPEAYENLPDFNPLQ